MSFINLNVLKQAAADFLAKDAESRAATSACTRAKTVLRNAIKEFLLVNKLQPETKFLLDGMEFEYAASEESYIDPKKWLRLYEDGTLSERQFLDAITVRKPDASRIYGEDRVLKLIVKEKGTRADVRLRKSEKVVKDLVVLAAKEKPVANVIKKSGLRKIKLR